MIASDESDVFKSMNVNLFAIRKLIEIQSKDALTKELEKISSTPERRKMWVLSSGEFSTEQISKKVHVSDRSVQYFIKDAMKSGLLTLRKRGYPQRLIDFIPSHWKEPEQLEEQGEASTPTVSSASQTGSSVLTQDSSVRLAASEEESNEPKQE